MAVTNMQFAIHGSVQPGFELVQEEFVRNFTERGDLGAACTIYHRGQKVVDLWGGYQFGSTLASYGGPGSGGSLGFADPVEQVGYAYVTNKQWSGMWGDPREKALQDAFYRCLSA
jgi:CubicO group peptidase (beta-lactamase class C family)